MLTRWDGPVVNVGGKTERLQRITHHFDLVASFVVYASTVQYLTCLIGAEGSQCMENAKIVQSEGQNKVLKIICFKPFDAGLRFVVSRIKKST